MAQEALRLARDTCERGPPSGGGTSGIDLGSLVLGGILLGGRQRGVVEVSVAATAGAVGPAGASHRAASAARAPAAGAAAGAASDRTPRQYRARMDGVRAVLIDIDGVLTVSWKPFPARWRRSRRAPSADLPFALVTNTTSRTRARIAETLVDAGFPVGTDDVLGAPAATAAHLREHHPGAACLLLSSRDVADDLDGVRLVGPDADDVDVVVLGGAGPEFSYEALDTVYRHLQHDAALVAMHRNLYWRTDAGLQLDAGAFLLGLEKAADVEAVVLGKPSGAFFAAALSTLGVGRSEAVMVGDDLEADVLGAQRAGITGVLVRTGSSPRRTRKGSTTIARSTSSTSSPTFPGCSAWADHAEPAPAGRSDHPARNAARRLYQDVHAISSANAAIIMTCETATITLTGSRKTSGTRRAASSSRPTPHTHELRR